VQGAGAAVVRDDATVGGDRWMTDREQDVLRDRSDRGRVAFDCLAVSRRERIGKT
jgi:hypothetical protein